ncbi:hypothetical protein [Sphingobium xenophagum]|uniref:hypothetical protein n=1 Tax=Sphingobium xenophagum TaxID=121428 RepID=UPI0002E1BDC0|nr:hypothetical protein [Sphingobium xenophagum]
MTRIVIICIAALSMCARAGSVIMRAVDRIVDPVVNFVCDAIAVAPRLAFDFPGHAATIAPLGSSFSAQVDRHEAGMSRRAAARNI